MKKRFGLFIVVLIIGVCATLLFGVDLNKHRRVYDAVSTQNPLEGYWVKTSTVETFRVNYTPTGVTYYFEMNVDSANCAGGVLTTIDIPLWKHWGKIGTIHVAATVDGSNGDFTQDNDSVHVLLRLQGLNATGQTITIATFSDSSNDEAAYDSVNYYIDAEVDITTEENYWERGKLIAIQSLVDSTNTDTLDLDITLTLPYSDQYLETDYYKNHQLVR